jgi:FAD:protein FMN transferase
MGTLVRVEVVASGRDVEGAVDRAFGWFREIEARCTRFDPASELRQATRQAGVAVAASPILFEAVRFALMVAEESGGAFDPTVGRRMEARGFDRHYRTGDTTTSEEAEDGVTYRDVELDREARTIRLRQPLTLDLGAVAKGMAVDAAARELEPYRNFAIDAGGDLYLGGCNRRGAPWSVGIRSPRNPSELIAAVEVSDRAVCTSGDYERRAVGGEHHILDPRTGASPRGVASATVIAPGAMLADAVATAALVLGPEGGIALLNRLGLDGLVVTSDMEQIRTGGFCRAA